jgi:hypothetical protein
MPLITALLLCCLPQASTPSLPITRAGQGLERPHLDGKLDEPFWAEAALVSGFVQTLPVAGAEPSQRTEVLLSYDDTDLYVGLRCYDTEPTGIRATQMARDANLNPDDRVELLFDTFDDNRNAFWFQLGPAGSKGDALLSRSGNDFNKRWDTIWYAQTTITEEGWFGEIRIPMASLNFDPEGEQWGFNARRFIRRNDEEARWASPEPRLRFFQPANAGTVTGFHGMQQGVGLDVVPFFVGSYLNPNEPGDHILGDSGLDLFYRISPSTKLSLSYNTDFAETEVDSRSVNLSRFQLFFPEKRKFFLEDSGIFSFGLGGKGGSDVLPFFSRRIGLDSDGNEVPLLANAKLTMSNDSYSFGLLDSQTESANGIPDRNLLVGRFSKNILEQSSVGAIYTRGNPTGSTEDYTVGADLQLQTTRFMADRSLRLRGYVMGTEDSETRGNNLAYAASLDYPNDEIEASLDYSVVEENFNPALGFVRQKGIETYSGSFAYSPRLYSSIRRLQFSISPRVTLNTAEDRTELERISIMPLGIDWESGERLRFRVYPQRERLFEDFEIQDSIFIPEGVHEQLRYNISLDTSEKREFSVEADFSGGSFYNGDREDYDLEFDWRPSAQASFRVEYNHRDVHLPGGDFKVNVLRLRTDLHLSPQLSWANNIQWDDRSDNLGLNSRLRMIIEPGRDLFFVLNQGWSTLEDELNATETALRFKVSYTFRF